MYPEVLRWEVRLYLGNAFFQPRVEQATVLPTDQVIFSITGGYVMLLDGETQRLAILARGVSPVVALDISGK